MSEKTIQQVAKVAGVSVATVSRVLNKNESVSDETRARVESVIKMLNYEPNMLGRNLRRSKSGMILAMLPSISNPFYAKIVQGIEDTCRKNNYNVLLCDTETDVQREKIYINLLKSKLAEGIIWLDPVTDTTLLNEIAQFYPIVQCSEYAEGINIPYVSIDNELAAYRATKHLISIGHRKIALINSDERFLYARLRRKGYVKALEESGITINDEWIISGELTFENGHRVMKYLLSVEDRPTAVFAVSDILAIGVLKAIKERGLAVPRDIAVVGFDNIQFASMTNPTLTTIDQPMYTIGCEAASMIIKIVNNVDLKIGNIILDHQLIIRESTME